MDDTREVWVYLTKVNPRGTGVGDALPVCREPETIVSIARGIIWILLASAAYCYIIA